jgi:tRNA dimethylallyltransferase
VELTGTFVASLPDHRSVYDVVQVGLDRPDLDERIERRVEEMWRAGLVDEVVGLVPQGLREGRTASRALGYAQVLAALDGTLGSMAEAKVATATATRRFARRQRSWFRRDRRISWFESPDLAEVRRLVCSLATCGRPRAMEVTPDPSA